MPIFKAIDNETYLYSTLGGLTRGLRGLNPDFILKARAWNQKSSAILYEILRKRLEPDFTVIRCDATNLSFIGVNALGEQIKVQLYPKQGEDDYPLLSIAKCSEVKTYECEYNDKDKSLHFGLLSAYFDLNGTTIYRECQNTEYSISIKKGGYILDVKITKKLSSCLLNTKNKVYQRTLFNEEDLLETLAGLETPFKGIEVAKIIFEYFAGLNLLYPLPIEDLLGEIVIKVSKLDGEQFTLVQKSTFRKGQMVECTKVISGSSSDDSSIFASNAPEDNAEQRNYTYAPKEGGKE